MILVLKHIDIEDAGTLGTYLHQKGKKVQTASLHRGDSFPSSLEGVEAVISCGGPMNVDEEGRYPFLPLENDFIQRVLVAQIPFLGLCLGGQLLAKAAGASIGPSPWPEIGFDEVQLTSKGQEDSLLAGLPLRFKVFQWHEDMFQIPEGGQLLASSARCPHQAFRFGPKAYALQFHLEITDHDIHTWVAAYKQGQEAQALLEAMLRDYQQIQEAFSANARIIFQNFLTMV